MKLKALTEKRAELVEKMNSLVNQADTENRAMSEEEAAAFDAAEKEIKDLDATIAREERARKLAPAPARTANAPAAPAHEDTEIEERAFADYILGRAMENRAGEIQLTQGNNGVIVPTTIANRIITKVRDMVSPKRKKAPLRGPLYPFPSSGRSRTRSSELLGAFSLGGSFRLGFGQAGQFDDGHGSVIALAGHGQLHHAGVTTRHTGELGTNFVKQALNQSVVAQHAVSQTAGVQVVALGQGDQRLDNAAEFLGFHFGGADAAVDKQRLGEIVQQGLTVRRRPRKFFAGIAMPHFAASFSSPDISFRNRQPSCRNQGPCRAGLP